MSKLRAKTEEIEENFDVITPLKELDVIVYTIYNAFYVPEKKRLRKIINTDK